MAGLSLLDRVSEDWCMYVFRIDIAPCRIGDSFARSFIYRYIFLNFRYLFAGDFPLNRVYQWRIQECEQEGPVSDLAMVVGGIAGKSLGKGTPNQVWGCAV